MYRSLAAGYHGAWLLVLCASLLCLATSSLAMDPDCDGKNATFCDYKVERLGDNVTMYCNNTSAQARLIPPYGFSPVSWMLRIPELRWINESEGRYIIEDDRWALTIINTTLTDIGQYHCVLRNISGDWYLVKTGVNIKGPYFENGWDMYNLNVGIGFAAMVGFLLLTACALVLYKYRFIPEPREVGVLYSLPNEINDEKVDDGISDEVKKMDDTSSSDGINGTKAYDDVSSDVKPKEIPIPSDLEYGVAGTCDNAAFTHDDADDDVTSTAGVAVTPNGVVAAAVEEKNATMSSNKDIGADDDVDVDHPITSM